MRIARIILRTNPSNSENWFWKNIFGTTRSTIAFCIKIRRAFNSWLNGKSFRWLYPGSNVTLYLFLICLILGANLMLTHFVPFNSCIPLEKSENLCYCDVFRRYRKRPLTWNWLICFFSSGVSYLFLVLDFWSFFHEKSGDFRESYQIFLGVGNNSTYIQWETIKANIRR